MPSAPLSVQLYTVREALAADLPGTLARIAELGFTDVELYGFADREHEFADGLAAAGLRAPSGHASLVEVEDPAVVFAVGQRLGLTTVIDPAIRAERWADREGVATIASQLNALAPMALEHGVRVGYHNHDWELSIVVDGTPALEVLADLLDDDVALEVDTFWSEVGGVPAADLLRRLGDRVTHIHVKDGPLTKETATQTAVGAGGLDIAGILAAAPQAQPVVELDDHTGDVFEALRESVAFLNSGVRG